MIWWCDASLQQECAWNTVSINLTVTLVIGKSGLLLDRPLTNIVIYCNGDPFSKTGDPFSHQYYALVASETGSFLLNIKAAIIWCLVISEFSATVSVIWHGTSLTTHYLWVMNSCAHVPDLSAPSPTNSRNYVGLPMKYRITFKLNVVLVAYKPLSLSEPRYLWSILLSSPKARGNQICMPKLDTKNSAGSKSF